MIPPVGLSIPQLERFRDLTLRRLGLRFEPGQLGDLAEALRRRLAATGRLPDNYLDALESKEARDELGALAQELTVNETYFFRHREQFQALLEAALPTLSPSPGRPLRLLSAGCASGEEPYTLSILLAERPELRGCEVTIDAFDIDAAALEHAGPARYSPWSLRETPADVQARCFRPDGRVFVLRDEFRAGVRFRVHNLAEPDLPWPAGSFDVILCRNVLMYFAPEVAAAAVARLSRCLVPGGYLFLGYAENLRGLSQEFHLCHSHGTFYYRRHSEARADAPLPPPSPAEGASWVEVIRNACERIESLAAPLSASPPPAPRPTPVDTAAVIQLLQQERYPEAHAALAQLPPEATADPDVLLLRAVLHTHGGDLATAEKLCARVLELDGLSAGAHYLTALCREDVGDRAGAANHDQIASYLDPAFAMPRFHLGLLARRAGDRQAAQREFREALALLQREDASRLLLFAGGFGREALLGLCRAELRACGGSP